MSIVVLLKYTGKDGNAQRFASEMEESGIAASIRQEAGNLRYEYYVPVSDPETVLLIDEWTDQQALDIHHATPMMGQIMKLREKYDLHVRAERLISDENGIPTRDRAFLKD